MQMAVDKQILTHLDEEVASWSERLGCVDGELMMQL